MDKELLGKVSELSVVGNEKKTNSQALGARRVDINDGGGSNSGSRTMTPPTAAANMMIDGIPKEIQDILEKLDNEGAMLLTMSELVRLKAHIANQSSQNRMQQSEKNQLTLEIYKLRDLLADVKNLNSLCTSVEESDWRAGIIRAISEIFVNQKEHLLAELSSFVASSGVGGNTSSRSGGSGQDIMTAKEEYLEAKIADLTRLNQKSMDYLVSIDRDSFKKEIESLKTKNVKYQDQIEALQKTDRELKRERKRQFLVLLNHFN